MDNSTQLAVCPTPHTATAVTALRDARRQVPCHGSICAALDLADPEGELPAAAYAEAVFALDVAARVFGHQSAAAVGAHHDDAALLCDIAIYHLTGAESDIRAALIAFRRAAGPRLDPTRA